MKRLIFILILFILIIYPLGQLSVLPLPIASVRINLIDLLIGITLLIIFFLKRHDSIKFFKLPLSVPLGLFIGITFLSMLLNPLHLVWPEWLVAVSYGVRFTMYCGIYVIIATTQVNQKKNQDVIVFFHYLSGVLLALFGLIQYVLYPNLRNLYYLGWDPHQYRLFSTLFDPNFTGLILVLSLLLGLTVIIDLQGIHGHKTRKIIVYLTFIVLLVALALTYSRSSYIVLIISLIVYFRKRITPKIALGSLFLIAIILIALPRPFGEGVRLGRTSTIISRLESYQQAVQIISHYPLFGVGFNAYRYALLKMHYLPSNNWQDIHSGSGADNSLLFVWATTGITGFISYLYLGIVLFRRLRSNPSVFAPCIGISMLASLIHGFFTNSLFYPHILVWLWFLIGIFEARTLSSP